MVTLTEEIRIKAPYEKLTAWVDGFEEEFVKWSPYHLECDLYGQDIAVGSRLRFREIVMGLDYDVTGTIVRAEKSVDHFFFEFQSDKKTAGISFEGRRTNEGCVFRHTESFGLTTPVIGPIINFLVFKVFYRKKADWDLIRNDMILDNKYLNEILTEGRYPERIPIDELLKPKATA